MKRLLTFVTLLGMSLALAGCEQKSKVTTEKTIKTPEGSTTIQTEKTIKQSGENPPAVAPIEPQR